MSVYRYLPAIRPSGYSFQGIADQLGFSNRSSARKAVIRLLEQYETDEVEKYRQLENYRLEELQSEWWLKAIRPSQSYNAHKEQLDATKMVLAIMKRRAELLGLDRKIKPIDEEVENIQVIWNTPETVDEE